MINPDAGNLGAKVGFVFFGLGVPLCVAFYFLIPETKGFTFEDVSCIPTSHLSFLCPLSKNPLTEATRRWTTCLLPGFPRETSSAKASAVTQSWLGGMAWGAATGGKRRHPSRLSRTPRRPPSR